MPLPGAGTLPSPSLLPGVEAGSFVFLTPTRDVWVRLTENYPRSALIGAFPYGLSVWRVEATGEWREGFMPSAEEVAAADRFYGGGRVHELTDAERAELIAAGYGDYIEEAT